MLGIAQSLADAGRAAIGKDGHGALPFLPARALRPLHLLLLCALLVTFLFETFRLLQKILRLSELLLPTKTPDAPVTVIVLGTLEDLLRHVGHCPVPQFLDKEPTGLEEGLSTKKAQGFQPIQLLDYLVQSSVEIGGGIQD